MQSKQEVTSQQISIAKTLNKNLNLQEQNIQGQPKNLIKSIGKKQLIFTREMDDFYCDFSLQEQESLKIVLTSQADASIYCLNITKQSKKANDELNMFESIAQIYDYIEENTIQVTENQDKKLIRIAQNGQMEIQVITMLGKKERKKIISLYPQQMKQNKQQFLQNAIRKIGRNMIQLKKQLKKTQIQLKEVIKLNQNQKQRQANIGNKFRFKPNSKDKYISNFKLADKKITKIGDSNTYFSIVASQNIPKQGTSFFDVKIINSPLKNIMIGIGSKFTLELPNVYSHQDFIGFYILGQGYVWEKSNQRDLELKNLQIQNGVTIRTNINMTNGYINWQICGVKVAYAIIPLELKAKILFPHILLITPNDTIQLDFE